MAIRTNLEAIPHRSLQFKLPSAALPYKERFPEMSDIVDIKPYTIAVESILVGNRTGHDKMAMITSKVIDLPKAMKVDDLLVADQFVILAIARALTYGENYRWFVTCPNCKYREECSCKVPDELPVRTWQAEQPFPEIKLPEVKDTVGLRFLTVRDEGEIDRYEKQITAATKGSTEDASEMTYVRRMAYHIKTVGGGDVESIEEAEGYLRRLRGADVAAFKLGIEEHSCGIDYEWKICCDSCQHVYTTGFPITQDFFRRNRQ